MKCLCEQHNTVLQTIRCLQAMGLAGLICTIYGTSFRILSKVQDLKMLCGNISSKISSLRQRLTEINSQHTLHMAHIVLVE